MAAHCEAGENYKNAELRRKLAALIAERRPGNLPSMEKDFSPADVIVTHNEVNEKHGVGVLTRKIFGEHPNIISIRSQNHFNGEQQFGAVSLLLSYCNPARPEVFRRVIEAFEGRKVRRIVCIPFYADDVLSAIAVKEIFGVPLCSYVMDDQNVYSSGIPDHLMRELLGKSTLRLAISAELRAAYERKYGHKFWLLPPVVLSHLIEAKPEQPNGLFPRNRGIIVGNIWGQRWLELLRKTIKGSAIEVDWYCNSDFSGHHFDPDQLAREGIRARPALPEGELAPLLRRHSFVVLPSGTLDETDDRKAIAQLSLPSKVPFILATSNTPIVVLGNRETAAARFVVRCQIGTVAEYDTGSFRRAVEYVTSPEVQLSMRHKAAAMAKAFSADGIADWLWQSLEHGRAYDERFERLMPFREQETADFAVEREGR